MNVQLAKAKTFFRPTQHLVIWSTLHQQPKKTTVTLADFVVPYSYTHSLTTRSYELLRALLALFSMQEDGINITSMEIDVARWLNENKKFKARSEAEVPDIFPLDLIDTIFQKLPKLYYEAFARIPELGPGGTGTIDPRLDTHPMWPHYWSLLQVLPYTKLHLTIQHTKLKKIFTQYFTRYREDNLTLSRPDLHILAPSKGQHVFSECLRRLVAKQRSQDIIFECGAYSAGDGKLDDEFLRTCKVLYPDVYRRWEDDVLELPFFHELYWHEFQQKITIRSWQLTQRGRGWLFFKRRSKPVDKAFHEIPLKAFLALTVADGAQSTIENKKRKSNSTTTKVPITSIAIERSTTTTFVAYINGSYPITFSKRRKYGELLYRLAQKGEVGYRSFARSYEYIQSDPGFRLFAQTHFEPTEILMRTGTHGQTIIPHTAITFELIESTDRPE